MTDPASFTPREARVALPRAWLFWSFLGLMPITAVLPIVFLCLSVTSPHGVLSGSWILHAIIGLSLVSSSLGLAARRWPRRLSGALSVTPEGLAVDGVCAVRKDEIKQAMRNPSASLAEVRVLRRFSVAADIVLASATDAQELLAALAQDPGHATATFRGYAGGTSRQMWLMLLTTVVPFVGFVVGLLGIGIGVPGFATHVMRTFVAFIAAMALSTAVAYVAGASTLVVGADGVLVRRPFRRSVFYPYAELAAVQQEGEDVILTRASGEVARYGFQGAPGMLGMRAELPVVACATRIDEARARHAQGGRRAAEVARRGREGEAQGGERGMCFRRPSGRARGGVGGGRCGRERSPGRAGPAHGRQRDGEPACMTRRMTTHARLRPS